jgi:hypothetical protein
MPPSGLLDLHPDVRNLGEYLFRCNTYPPSVITNFDLTFSRLSGGRVSATFMDMVNLQVLLTQQNDLPSLYDPSLSVLADYNYKKTFDVGAGIMFDRFIAVDSLSTYAPGRLGVAPTTYFDTTDSTTKILGHGGIRMMSRFSFEVKRLLFSDGMGPFGKNDLRQKHALVLADEVRGYLLNPLVSSWAVHITARIHFFVHKRFIPRCRPWSLASGL